MGSLPLYGGTFAQSYSVSTNIDAPLLSETLQNEMHACKRDQIKKSKAWSTSRTRSERDRNEMQICIIWGYEGTRQGSMPVYTRIFLIGAAGSLKRLKNEIHA